MAVAALMNKEVDRIILARPAVEAGEKLGFLPGDLFEKVNPYLRPLYDALHDLMEIDNATDLLHKGIIEVAPLAFMRGRTLNDSFVILDEAQNATSEQMKMFLTRLGFNSKAVITGDITQIDLNKDRQSGLIHVMQILKNINGISFNFFEACDVVRHPLVQKIIQAYAEYEKKEPVIIGIMWLTLSIVFEFIFGHYVMGNSWELLLADYNILEGRVWSLVLITTFFAPIVWGKYYQE